MPIWDPSAPVAAHTHNNWKPYRSANTAEMGRSLIDRQMVNRSRVVTIIDINSRNVTA
jgi:hypothetical protein